VTYPLDIIRFRMAVDPTLNTIPQVVRAVIRDEGMGAFYKGLLPSCIGIAPYSSINFAAFDMCVGQPTTPRRARADGPARASCCSLKKALPEEVAGQSSAVFACSLAAAALVRASRPMCLHARAMALMRLPARRLPAAATRWTPSAARCS
jgi:solute carrier family 25 phosphate transporter 23/24/25/41